MGWDDHIDLDPVLFRDIDEKHVCINCLADEGLKVYVVERVAPYYSQCSYCSGDSKSVPVAELQTHIRNYFDYGRAVENLPLDSDPGQKFFGKQWDSTEVLERFLASKICESLYEDLQDNLIDEYYCEADWASLPLDAQWKGQWDEFSTFIERTESGFRFNITRLEEERNHDEPHPAGFYKAISTALIRSNAISVIPAGTQIQRVQWGYADRTFERLTCPPSAIAGENRFSPKGVSMFYGASDFETACIEINAKPGDKVTLGLFETSRDLAVIDFTATQFPRGDFDPAWQGNYHIAAFLNGFLADIRRDVKGEGATGEYLPTQALCHFFKNNGAAELIDINANNLDPGPAMQAIAANKKIDGIRFHSSKVEGSGSDCFVLFCNHSESAIILKLVHHDHLTL